MEETMLKQVLEITSKALDSVNSKKDANRIDILTDIIDVLVSRSCKHEYLSRVHETTKYIFSHQILISYYDQNGKFLYLSCNECESDFYVFLRKVFEAIKQDDPLFNLDYLVHDFMVLFNIKDMKILNTRFNEKLNWDFESMFEILKAQNKKLTDKEIILALKQNGISKNATKSTKPKSESVTNVGNTDSI